MAPSKNLVTGVCVLLAAPLAYGAYQQFSTLGAAVVLFTVGILIPQLYAKIAIPNERTSTPDPER